MDVVDNNDFHVFCIWLLKTIFTFSDVVIIMTSLMFFVFGWKTIFRFYMDVVDNNDFLDVFMYLIVGNNIWILHGCCG